MGEVRGDGYLWAIELVEDKNTLETLRADTLDHVAANLLPKCLGNGLLVRVDARVVPSIVLSPLLIATIEGFKFIERTLHSAIMDTFNCPVSA